MRRVTADGADSLGVRVRAHRDVPAVISAGPAPRHRESSACKEQLQLDLSRLHRPLQPVLRLEVVVDELGA